MERSSSPPRADGATSRLEEWFRFRRYLIARKRNKSVGQCGWPAPSRHELGAGLNGFSNGEYQSPQRSQPPTSRPSASTAKMSVVRMTPRELRGLYALVTLGARAPSGE